MPSLPYGHTSGLPWIANTEADKTQDRIVQEDRRRIGLFDSRSGGMFTSEPCDYVSTIVEIEPCLSSWRKSQGQKQHKQEDEYGTLHMRLTVG